MLLYKSIHPYHYLYLHVSSQTVLFHVFSATFAAMTEVLQHKNETTPDIHHIIVTIRDSGEQFSSDRDPAYVERHPWLHLGSARTLSAPRWFKETTLLSSPVLFSACEITYHEVDLISIKWTLFSERNRPFAPRLWVKKRLVTALGTAREFLIPNQLLRRGFL